MHNGFSAGSLSHKQWKTLVSYHHGPGLDRKSTRLNSSHTVISYAVFCLKKKKKTRILITGEQLENTYRNHTAYYERDKESRLCRATPPCTLTLHMETGLLQITRVYKQDA